MNNLRNIIIGNPNVVIAVIGLILLLAVIIGTFLITRNMYRVEEPVPIVTVPNTSPNQLKQEIPELTQSDAKELSKQIQRVTEQQAPQYHYYTYTHEAADTKAQQYAKEQNADKIIKETQYVPIYVQDNNTKTNNDIKVKTKDKEQITPKTQTDDKIIENNYYAINLNKKHSIEAGAKYVDNIAYVAASYRNRDIRYEIMYAPEKNRWGAGIMFTVAKW